MPNPSQINIPGPVLSDAAAVAINEKLSARLAWLNNAFGVCQRVRKDEGVFPEVPVLSNATKDYLSVLPNSDLGNFLFWDVRDGETVERQGDFFSVRFEAGVVFWGDLRSVFTATAEEWKGKTAQHVEKLVLEAFIAEGFAGARVQLNRVFRDAPNIYPGYFTKEIKRQFLLRPYFGFRVEVTVVAFSNGCE